MSKTIWSALGQFAEMSFFFAAAAALIAGTLILR